MSMNPEVKAQWGAWLLEHESDQGRGLLRRETPEGSKFCCLGGLCELAVAAGIVKSARGDQPGYYPEGSPCRENGLPPEEVSRWAGLPHSNPAVITRQGFRSSLAELNDSGMPFREIWQLIEAQL